jgi:long-chain acyl-CoA synthetase
MTQVERLRDALHTLGLKPGDRVMLLLPNIPQMVIAFFSVLEAGAAAVFSPPATSTEDLIHQIRSTGTRILFVPIRSQLLTASLIELSHTDPDFPLEKIVLVNPIDYLPWMKRYLARIRYGPFRTPQIQTGHKIELYDFNRLLISRSHEQFDLDIDPENLAAIQFTGGTTAVPKGVMVSHYNLVANALQTRHWIPDAKEGGERFLCVLPFSHSYGLTTALNVPIALGASLVLKPQFEVTDLLRTIQRYRPTIFPGVPAMYLAIKEFPGVRRFGIDSIKACLSGSAPLPVEVQEAFEKLTRGRLIEGYGLTEAGPVTHANPLYGQRKLGSIGIPLPSTRAKIVDLASGKKEVQSGHIGELAVSGPQVMLGYWNDVKATRKVFTPDGFLLTGDVAQMDTEGYFRIIARKADMWYPHKPGKPAFPRDIEEVLYEIPQIKEVAVVAIANQPIAFVIAQQNRPRVEDMIAYCRRRLPPELVPRLVIFVDDFPRNFIGKIIRRELARHFQETHQIRE